MLITVTVKYLSSKKKKKMNIFDLPALLAGVEVASVLADLEGVEATLSSSRLRL